MRDSIAYGVVGGAVGSRIEGMTEEPNRGATLPTMRARAGRWTGVLAMSPGRAVVRSVGGSLIVLALVAGTPADVVRADEHEIAITDTGFDPDSTTVLVGEPVTWTNATSTEHAILTADGLLDSGAIGPGGAFGHVFETPGTVYYYDAGHLRMKGTIVVIAAAVTGISGPVVVQGGGNGSALFLAVAVVGFIAVLAAIAGLIGAARRPGR
jgi:plastocyanin